MIKSYGIETYQVEATESKVNSSGAVGEIELIDVATVAPLPLNVKVLIAAAEVTLITSFCNEFATGGNKIVKVLKAVNGVRLSH